MFQQFTFASLLANRLQCYEAEIVNREHFIRLLDDPENVDADVLRTMWSSNFNTMAICAILTNDRDIANAAYARARQVPCSQTIRDLRSIGIVMSGKCGR